MQKRHVNHLDDRGREVLDKTASNISVRREKMVGLNDQMRQVVQQMRHEAIQAEQDSLDDEKDFDLPDDEPRSPHELFAETEEYSMLLDDIATYSRNKKEAVKNPPPPEKPKAAEKAEEPPAAPEEKKGKK